MKQLLFILGVMGLICISNAFPITVDSVGDSYIKWSWNTSEKVINISVDGYEIRYFDTKADTFTLSGLYPLESHTLKVYTNNYSGISTANTSSPIKDNQDSVFDWLMIYIPFILGCICLYIGLKIEKFVAFGAFFCGFIMVIESTNISIISLWLGIILCFASIFVVFRE